MGHDGLRVGVQIMRKFVIRLARICYRSVYNHPVLVGVFLMLWFLYRSFPFLFSLLVSASPVLVCTAVLLGTLLSFGESNTVPRVEEDEGISPEISELKTGVLETSTVVDRGLSLGEDRTWTELRKEMVEKSIDEDDLLDGSDSVGKSRTDDDLVISSMPSYHSSREIEFGEQRIDEVRSELEAMGVGQMVNLGNDKIAMGIEAGVVHEEILENRSSAAKLVEAENFDDYKSAEGSIDQMRDLLESSMQSEEQLSEVLEESLSRDKKDQSEDSENYETGERSNESQIGDQLEYSSESWTQFDILEDRLSSAQKIQGESFEDHISREGSVDVQIGSPLELSLGSWNHLDSDHEGDNESDSSSDGAESSSPDASMADIIPMLDELHPLLEDENLQTGNPSSPGSAASTDRSSKSGIHSDEESDQRDEEEAGEGKSDMDEDNEEETEGGARSPAKSAIMWTEDDQKNLMDLGTSELERNQRLESLIARRRARRMVTDRNLIDLEGMDLTFSVAPITTTRYNPFDNPNDSYADLGLPPIPGSAPSILWQRPNPFDLPYDSSEEKPDLTGDSFQEEFMELTQQGSSSQRDAVFRRNETFSMGSSIFDFGRSMGRGTTRASRFRPYFIPERTDSDVMSYSSFQRQYSGLSESRTSYSSLQRQTSELSESRASSLAETDTTFVGEDHYEKKISEDESGQDMEPSGEVDHASDHGEHGSQSSEDGHSLSDKENETTDIDLNVPVIESSGIGTSASASHTSEAGPSAELRLEENANHVEAEYVLSDRKISASDMQYVTESMVGIHGTSSSSSASKECDVEGGDALNIPAHGFDNIATPIKYSVETSASDIQTEHSVKETEFSHSMAMCESHPKEPIYDSSPLAIKKSLSSSSISSDLHRETSDIDLYHVQRDLFADSKVGEENAEDDATQNKHRRNDSGLDVDGRTEVIKHSVTEYHISELKQQPCSSIEPAVAEFGIHSSKDFADIGMVKNDLLDAKVSSGDTEQVFMQEDKAEVHEDMQNAGLDQDYMPVADEYKFPEDVIIGSVGTQIDIDNVPEADLQEDTGTTVKSYVNGTDDQLFFTLDEAHDAPHDSGICEPEEQESTIKLQEFSQLTEVHDAVDGFMVQEPDPVQNNEASCLEELEAKSVAALAVENSVQAISETELADTKEGLNDVSHGHDESMDDELIVDEENLDIKEIDEGLLSELDAVGDFSVNDIELNLSNSHPTARDFSDIHEQVLAEVHPYSGVSSLKDRTDIVSSESSGLTSEPNIIDIKESNTDSLTGDVHAGLVVLETQSADYMNATLIKASEEMQEDILKPVVAESVPADSTEEGEARFLENELSVITTETASRNMEVVSPLEPVLDRQEPVPERSGSDLDSLENQIPDYVMKAKSGISLDTGVFKQSGSDFEEPVETDIDSCHDVEAPLATTESGNSSAKSLVDGNVKDIHESAFANDIDATLKKVSEDMQENTPTPAVAESVPADSADEVEAGYLGNELSAETTETVSQTKEVVSLADPALDSRELVSEGSGSDLASLEDQIPDSVMRAISGVSLDTEVFEQSGGDFEETVESDIDKRDDVEALLTTDESEISAIEPSIDGIVEDVHESAFVQENLALSHNPDYQTERVWSVESKSLQTHTDIKEMQEAPALVTSTSDSLVSGNKIVRVGCTESESMQRNTDAKETNELPVLEASVTAAVEFENQNVQVGSVESEPLPMDTDTKEILEPPVDDASLVSAPEFKDQIETFGSMKSKSPQINEKIEELQESRVEFNNAFPAEPEFQIQRNASVESKLFKMYEHGKEIQESPGVEESIASTVAHEDQSETNSQVETVEVQDLRDHQVTSIQQPEEPLPNSDDSTLVEVDSSVVSSLTSNELRVQGSKEGATENSSSQIEKQTSHLDFSSSSSSSSSLSDSDEHKIVV